MTKAEEKAKEAYPDNEVLFFAKGEDGKMHPVTNFGREIKGFIRGYNQAIKDLAQDFHADTLIGDKDYEVIHTVAYGCGDEMHTTEISVETEMFKPGQKVKVIIVDDE